MVNTPNLPVRPDPAKQGERSYGVCFNEFSRHKRFNEEGGEAFVAGIVGVDAVVGEFVPVVAVHARVGVSVQDAEGVALADLLDARL